MTSYVLYRCATEKERKSLRFLSQKKSKNTILKLLNNSTEPTNPIDATFSRDLPVHECHSSRFVPAGYSSHASYFSTERDVTFYEYLYHILTEAMPKNYKISLTIFSAEINLPTKGNKNINKMKQKSKKQILAPNTYIHSHAYMNAMIKKVPSSVIYENVRGLTKANNYAIFQRKHIGHITKNLNTITAQLISNSGKNFKVEISESGMNKTIEIPKKFFS